MEHDLNNLRFAYIHIDQYGDRSDYPSVGIIWDGAEARSQIEWVRSLMEQGHSMGPVYRMQVRTKAKAFWFGYDDHRPLADLFSNLQDLYRHDTPQGKGFFRFADFAAHGMADDAETLLAPAWADARNHGPWPLYVAANNILFAEAVTGQSRFILGDYDAEQTGMITATEFVDWLCH